MKKKKGGEGNVPVFCLVTDPGSSIYNIFSIMILLLYHRYGLIKLHSIVINSTSHKGERLDLCLKLLHLYNISNIAVIQKNDEQSDDDIPFHYPNNMLEFLENSDYFLHFFYKDDQEREEGEPEQRKMMNFTIIHHNNYLAYYIQYALPHIAEDIKKILNYESINIINATNNSTWLDTQNFFDISNIKKVYFAADNNDKDSQIILPTHLYTSIILPENIISQFLLNVIRANTNYTNSINHRDLILTFIALDDHMMYNYRLLYYINNTKLLPMDTKKENNTLTHLNIDNYFKNLKFSMYFCLWIIESIFKKRTSKYKDFMNYANTNVLFNDLQKANFISQIPSELVKDESIDINNLFKYDEVESEYDQDKEQDSPQDYQQDGGKRSGSRKSKTTAKAVRKTTKTKAKSKA